MGIKTRRIALLLLSIASLVGGVAQAQEAALPQIESGCEIDYPPFCIVHEDGLADGFSVELFAAALSKMGTEVSFRTGPWAEVRVWLERGEIDALPLVGRTPEREALFDFSVPYVTMHGAIVVAQDTTGINTLADLSGRVVGVMASDNAEEFLRREPRNFEIVTLTSFADALQLLADGGCDAVVLQRLVALRLIDELGLETVLRVVDQPVTGFSQEFCFAVTEGNHQLLSMLNEGLAIALADGTYRRLYAKWFAHMELPSDRAIIIGGDAEYPPFEYLDEQGRPAGYNVDLLRAVAAAAGLTIEIRLGPWPEMVEALKNGEIDAMEGMFYSLERDKFFDFSQTHLVNHCVAVVRRGEGPPASSPEELRGKSIVVQESDIMHEYAIRQGLGDSVTAVASQEDALRALAAGEYDVALAARITALYWIERSGWRNLEVGQIPLLSQDFCFAVPEGSRALLAELSEGLIAVEQSGEYRRIYEKWMGVYDPALRSQRAVRFLLIAVAASVLLIILISVWAWTLRSQVQKRTAALGAMSQRYQAMLEEIPDIVMEVDADKRYIWANPAGYAFFGDDVIGKQASDYFVGDQSAYKVSQSSFDNGDNTTYFKSVQRRSDGAERTLARWCRMLKDENGDVIGALSTARDVTEQERIAAALRESEQKYRSLIENAQQGVIIAQANPVRLRFANPAMSVITGYDEAELLAMGEQQLPALVHPDDRQRFFGSFRRRIAGEDIPRQDEYRVVRKDGITRWVSLYSSLISYLGEEATLTTFIDITERKEAEEERERLESQLQQAQKMEAIGRLAGGVAHDFNNLLMGIMNYAELCKQDIPPGHASHKWLDEITSEAERSASLAQQLLAFARRQTIAPQVVNLNDSIDSILRMVRRLIGEDIDLVWEPGERLGSVRMDPGQLDQVLANLCLNARDAIGGVGTLTIETSNASIDPEYCSENAEAVPGEYVLLAVSDDGEGMDGETRRQVFEPFFTTKGVGEGTGLGLATVYGIVKQNAGFLSVYSELGHGTTFRIYLPRVPGDPEMKEAADGEAPVGGEETILLVEDEAAIRETVAVLLERLGYTVLPAENPENSLRMASEHSGPIHLLITDIVMPGMTGRDLAERLLGFDTGMKVLYMSGYTADVIAHQGILDQGINFLSKPITRDELARTVRRILDDL